MEVWMWRVRVYFTLWPFKPLFITCLPPHYCTISVLQIMLCSLFFSVSSLQTHTRQQAVRAASPPLWPHCPRRHQAARPPAPRALWAPWRSGSRTLYANSVPGPPPKGSVRSANLRESLHLLRLTAIARIWAAPQGLTRLSPSCPSPTENWWAVVEVLRSFT